MCHYTTFVVFIGSLSNLKEKYMTAFRHKRVHNCITQSIETSRIIMASVGNFSQLIQAIITAHTPYAC